MKLTKWMRLILILNSIMACTPSTTKTLIEMQATPAITSVQISGDTLSIQGSSFDYISSVSIYDASGSLVSNLNSFTFTQNQIRGTLSSGIQLVLGAVYNLVISNATASTSIPISVDLDNITGPIGLGMTALNNMDIAGQPTTTSYPPGDTILGMWGTYGTQTSTGQFPGNLLNPLADINFYNAVENNGDPTQPIASIQANRDSSNYGGLQFFANSFSSDVLIPKAAFTMTNSANYSNNPLGVGLTALSGSNAPGAELDVNVAPTPIPTIYAGRFVGGADPTTVASDTVAIGGGSVSTGGDVLVGGKVGIANSSPTYALDVTGSIRASSCLLTGGGSLGMATISTNAVATSGTCTSDVRLKKDVKPYTIGMGKLLKVNPVTYRYNGLGEMPDDGSTLIGVVAQDLEKTVPELVGETEVRLRKDDKSKTRIKTVNYGHFTYMLINSVKELYQKFKGQDSEIDELRREIATLKKRIESLEKEKRSGN